MKVFLYQLFEGSSEWTPHLPGKPYETVEEGQADLVVMLREMQEDVIRDTIERDWENPDHKVAVAVWRNQLEVLDSFKGDPFKQYLFVHYLYSAHFGVAYQFRYEDEV